MHDLAALRLAYPLQNVSEADVEALLPSFRRHSYAPGEHVWQAGDPRGHLWFVISGQVRAVVTSPDAVEGVTDFVITRPDSLRRQIAVSAAR